MKRTGRKSTVVRLTLGLLAQIKRYCMENVCGWIVRINGIECGLTFRSTGVAYVDGVRLKIPSRRGIANDPIYQVGMVAIHSVACVRRVEWLVIADQDFRTTLRTMDAWIKRAGSVYANQRTDYLRQAAYDPILQFLND